MPADPLTAFARQWLRVQGLFSKKSDYEGKLGKAVMEIIILIDKQNHSGYSERRLVQIFNMIMLAYYRETGTPSQHLPPHPAACRRP